MLRGRLGIDSAKVPHKDRAGLLYLARGALTARDGALAFLQKETTAADALAPGDYAIPHQGVSMILLGPGSTVSHDALRLLAYARTALAAVGEDGARLYTAPPLIADRSGLARAQARCWADDDLRLAVARRMYAWRMGETPPRRSLDALRGLEGARMRESYRLLAVKSEWNGADAAMTAPGRRRRTCPIRRSTTQPARRRPPRPSPSPRSGRFRNWASYTRIRGNRSFWISPTCTAAP